jgi:hypothetical protein
MNRIRTAVLAALMVCAVSLGAAGTASAQDQATPFTKKVAITGSNKGKDFKGTFTVERFTTIGNKLYAVGTLRGTLKNRRVSRSNVRIPAAVTREGASASQATCDILHLTLGPLDLNLLGLRVQLNEVHLDITAIQGPGNLLGNLLCAITGLLDQNALAGAINNLAAALNAILALVPQGPATAATAVAGR